MRNKKIFTLLIISLLFCMFLFVSVVEIPKVKAQQDVPFYADFEEGTFDNVTYHYHVSGADSWIVTNNFDTPFGQYCLYNFNPATGGEYRGTALDYMWQEDAGFDSFSLWFCQGQIATGDNGTFEIMFASDADVLVFELLIQGIHNTGTAKIVNHIWNGTDFVEVDSGYTIPNNEWVFFTANVTTNNLWQYTIYSYDGAVYAQSPEGGLSNGAQATGTPNYYDLCLYKSTNPMYSYGYVAVDEIKSPTANWWDNNPYIELGTERTCRYGWTISPNVTFNIYTWGLTSNLIQGQGYTYTGNVISNSTPYGDGNYSYYTTGVYNNLNDAKNDLVAETVNYNGSGTYNINYMGTFNINLMPTYTQGSTVLYQGLLVNGTIRQTGERFQEITVLVMTEPTSDIRIYLSGGTFNNHELLTTTEWNQVNYGVLYTANGKLFLSTLLTGNYTYYLATTILTSSPLTAKNELFTNVSYGNVQNGLFVFMISPRTYNSFPLYQGIQITINGTQKTFWLEFIGTVNGLFSSNPATPNSNEYGGGMSGQMIQWLIMMFLMFVPVIGGTIFVAEKTHSGSATSLTFFGAGLIDIIIGVLIGFIDWWVIIIFGVFLIIAAYAQFGRVTSGG